jgi:hypothetical protein
MVINKVWSVGIIINESNSTNNNSNTTDNNTYHSDTVSW